ncbi:MAG: hypothetical protein ACI841_002333 [Planctomycetota bacterium]|jgi:hypothetical protein
MGETNVTRRGTRIHTRSCRVTAEVRLSGRCPQCFTAALRSSWANSDALQGGEHQWTPTGTQGGAGRLSRQDRKDSANCWAEGSSNGSLQLRRLSSVCTQTGILGQHASRPWRIVTRLLHPSPHASHSALGSCTRRQSLSPRSCVPSNEDGSVRTGSPQRRLHLGRRPRIRRTGLLWPGTNQDS